MEEDEREFLEHAGASSFDDLELDALMAFARAAKDANLRRLVRQLRVARTAARWALEYIETREGRAAIERDPRLRLVRIVTGSTPPPPPDDPAAAAYSLTAMPMAPRRSE